MVANNKQTLESILHGQEVAQAKINNRKEVMNLANRKK